MKINYYSKPVAKTVHDKSNISFDNFLADTTDCSAACSLNLQAENKMKISGIIITSLYCI